MKKWMLAGILFGAAAVGLFSSGETEGMTSRGPTREEMDRFIDGFDMNLEFKKPELPVYYAPVYDAKGDWDGKTLEELDKFDLVAKDAMENTGDREDRLKSRNQEIDRMNKFLLPGMWVKFDYNGNSYLRVILANVDIFVEDLSDSGKGLNDVRRPYNLTDRVFARQYRLARVDTNPVQVTIPDDPNDKVQNFYNTYLAQLKLGEGPSSKRDELFYLQPHILDEKYFDAVRDEVIRALNATRSEEMILNGSVFGKWLPMSLADGVKVKKEAGGITLSIKNWPHDDRVCNGF